MYLCNPCRGELFYYVFLTCWNLFDPIDVGVITLDGTYVVTFVKEMNCSFTTNPSMTSSAS